MNSSSKSIVAELNKGLKLNGVNYEVWSMKIRHLLEEQEILDSLSSVMAKPEEGTTTQHKRDLETYVAWRKKNSTARIILLSAMNDEIAKQFHFYDNAMDLWMALKQKFGGMSLPKLRSLALKFDTYKMRHDHTMKMHLREMSNMINELSDAGQKMTEEQKVQAVIRSLQNSWDHVRMHLIHNESIRTFEDAARHLELEEDRLTSIKINVEAHFTVENSSNNNANKRSYFDDYDKEQAQEPKKPKQKHEGNKSSMKKGKVNISRVKCLNCNQEGHYVNECMLPNYNIEKSSTRDNLVLCPGSGMQIVVKTLVGTIFILEVESIDTIDTLKAKIHAILGILPDQQVLLFNDKRLADGTRTIADYNIPNHSTIDMAVRIIGGKVLAGHRNINAP
ncbi:uncharacterized protein [Euphorbia lathyris]|uniref:uncharacterized protein isoform X2 n=1 Tax=Euphorbia lathyris TaxID=212925 RepID=UPI003313B5C0